jgi:glycosyltransferase involved in cell wall biosynthesis
MTEPSRAGIRVAVIDDNPHVTWEGRTYPVDATFDRFLPALLDVDGGVSSIDHCVPVRAGTAPPSTLPTDARLRVVATAPFDGIAGYLRHAPRLIRRNARILRPVVAAADLVWIKVPASNALVGGWLAVRAGRPRFGYVAGSALAVARGRGLGLAALAVGLAYDLAGRIAGGKHRIVVGEDIVSGRGIVTSLVEEHEIRDVSGSPWPAIPWRLRLAWAGRLAPGKGLEVLLDVVARLATEEGPNRIELVILGDGPFRAELEARAARLAIGDRIHWLGYVADRAVYLDALASCDLFVFPSPAEGFPKVALDAMAVGLPVVVTPTGTLGELGAAGIVAPTGPSRDAVLMTVRAIVGDASRAVALRSAGTAFVTEHSRGAEARRLLAQWRLRFPDLPWQDEGRGSGGFQKGDP